MNKYLQIFNTAVTSAMISPTAPVFHGDRKGFVKRFDYLMNKQCVYFLINGDSVVYVGRTNSPKLRLATHILSKKVFDSIMIIVFDESCYFNYIKHVEEKCIRIYQPLYNEHYTDKYSERLKRQNRKSIYKRES